MFPLFFDPATDSLSVLAGPETANQASSDSEKADTFIKLLEKKIGASILGHVVGETVTCKFQNGHDETLTEEERFINMSRIRKRQKKGSTSFQKYQRGYGHMPEVGEDLTRKSEPWLKATVTGNEDERVMIEYQAQVGKTIETFFGSAKISEDESNYLVVIDAKVGTLVKMGNQLGKTIAVDDESFRMDFGDLFGLEELSCDITILNVTEEKEELAAGKSAENTAKDESVVKKAESTAAAGIEGSMSIAIAGDESVESIDVTGKGNYLGEDPVHVEKGDIVRFDWI